MATFEKLTYGEYNDPIIRFFKDFISVSLLAPSIIKSLIKSKWIDKKRMTWSNFPGKPHSRFEVSRRTSEKRILEPLLKISLRGFKLSLISKISFNLKKSGLFFCNYQLTWKWLKLDTKKTNMTNIFNSIPVIRLFVKNFRRLYALPKEERPTVNWTCFVCPPTFQRLELAEDKRLCEIRRC